MADKWIVVLIIIAIVVAFFVVKNTLKFEEYSAREMIYFSADNCPYCKNFQPIWNAFVRNHSSNSFVTFKQMDANSGLATTYGVNKFPTVIGAVNGVKKATLLGQTSYENLVRFLQQLSAMS